MNKLTPPPVGEPWPTQGGIYAGIIRDVKTGNRWHLIMAEGQAKLPWGGYGEISANAADFTDGAANTKALLEDEHDHPAAKWAASISIDGHEDFYLPAQKELNLLYINLQDKCKETYHWSSTQCSSSDAWCQDFEDGSQDTYYKGVEFAVRAVRRLPI